MMETKTKWLIAAGAAFTANCQPCLKTIIKKALDSGADKKEIAEAIGVAKLVRKNAMTQTDRFASSLADIDVQGLSSSCGCSEEVEK
jgi:AhpD family alkylhydroperoxidase